MFIDRDPTAVVLVEGMSDEVAVETLAARLGRDLVAEGVAVVPIGGAQAIARVVAQLGSDVKVTGLCDVGEAPAFRRALGDGFYVCKRDLEDELIRAVGVDIVLQLLELHGDLRPFRTMQKQAAWSARSTHDQLRRLMGSGGRRKLRYARHLVDALDLQRVPAPLDGVLSSAGP
jgi:hypothetical protein